MITFDKDWADLMLEIKENLVEIKGNIKNMTVVSTDHESRLRQLENKISISMGAVGIISFMMSILIYFFKK